MHLKVGKWIRVVSFALAIALYAAAAFAQRATVTRNVSLRPDPSTNQPSGQVAHARLATDVGFGRIEIRATTTSRRLMEQGSDEITTSD
jgi:hypothetical protein